MKVLVTGSPRGQTKPEMPRDLAAEIDALKAGLAAVKADIAGLKEKID